METDEKLLQVVARYVEKTLGSEGFRYVSVVVANCKMLALQREVQEEERGNGEDYDKVDMDALVIAAYLHDISTASQGFQQHHIVSAQMAVEFLQSQQVAPELVQKVEQAILVHMTSRTDGQRDTRSLEGRILYDADKLGRLSGLAVVTSLIELGARYTNKTVTGDMLATMLRHIEERFIDLYQSLNTESARDMAREKFNSTLAFLDGVIEHLSDATPV
ncbi:MAG: hypothetical protein NVS4B11_19230 [Ktedonobacteraceae bacterium]